MASYSSREKMFLRDREISRSADHFDQGGFDFLSYRAANDSDFFPLPGDGCDARPNMITDFFGTCAYNYNAIESIPGATRTSLTGLFKHDLGTDLEFRAEFGYTNAISDNIVAPATIDNNDDLLAPATNPWNVGGIDYFDFWYRIDDTGPRTSDIETDNVRAVFELNGLAFDGAWDWQLGAVYNRAVTTNNQDNYVNKDTMQRALWGLLDVNNDGTITDNEHYNIWTPVTNPIDPALSNALRARPFRRSETELKSFDGNLSGPIWQMPAGPLSLAVGFEHRDERLLDQSDRASEANLILGSGGVSSSGSRSQSSIYGEFSIPITDTLEAQVAARYEDYDGFGSETNPKLAALWRPLDWLLVRGSWGEGFRAPSLPELFLGRSISFDNYIDQIRCPVTNTNFDCALDKQLDTTGNTMLSPETSESYSFGVVVEVPMVENMTIGLDYWHFQHDQLISDIDVDEILEREADCFNGLPTCDTALAALVSRTPPIPIDIIFGIPGTISTVTSSFLNLSEQTTDGFDFELRYVQDTSQWGSFRLTSYITYVNSFEFALRPTDPLESVVGQHLQPKLRATTDLSWNYNDLQVGLFNRYIGDHDQDETLAFFNGQEGAKIPSHSEWDVRFAYTGFSLFTLTVGIENVFAEDIPLDWDATEGYNVGYYNDRGRFIYSQVGFRF
jgi:outer membrane receptor protein involved in Fe transport